MESKINVQVLPSYLNHHRVFNVIFTTSKRRINFFNDLIKILFLETE